jgi:putative acetyltransferase
MKNFPNILLESPNQPEIVSLIEELDAYQMPLYPEEAHHGIDIDALSASNVLFAVIRTENEEVVACGALVLQSTYGELKRMFTKPASRGQGLARALLTFLEAEAHKRGCSHFVLETGYRQIEAISLYERCGYSCCGPFGEYASDPNSVFLEKVYGSPSSL